MMNLPFERKVGFGSGDGFQIAARYQDVRAGSFHSGNNTVGGAIKLFTAQENGSADAVNKVTRKGDSPVFPSRKPIALAGR